MRFDVFHFHTVHLRDDTWITTNKEISYKKSILNATDTATIPKGSPSPQSLATVKRNSRVNPSSPVYMELQLNSESFSQMVM